MKYLIILLLLTSCAKEPVTECVNVGAGEEICKITEDSKSNCFLRKVGKEGLHTYDCKVYEFFKSVKDFEKLDKALK